MSTTSKQKLMRPDYMDNEYVVQILEELGFDYKRFHIKLVKDRAYSVIEIKTLMDNINEYINDEKEKFNLK